MYKVLTLNKIAKPGLAELERFSEYSDKEASPDAIILRSYAMHDMELPESLAAVARAGAGVNNIPIDKCTERGIVVFNTPGANANAVKELVIAGLMLTSRKIWQGINWAQGLKGQDDVPALVEKGKAAFGGNEITGKTLGIVGVGGAIGTLVANAAVALGMKVIGYDPYISDKARGVLSPEVQIAELDAVFAESNFITLHVPYNSGTKHIVNAETLKACKQGAVILNFARGELVNDADIKAALSGGKIGFYITDFPNGELLGVDNVITVPHLGASTEEAEENCAVMAAVQLKDYLEKGVIVNSVNFPTMAEREPVKSDKRLCVAYNAEAEQDVLAGVKDILAKKGCEFTLDSAVKGKAGYALVYVSGGDSSALDGAVKQLPGVLSARVI
ncbi:MAG: 3-phosphoglycerate dehydrogenase [Clostridiales bacterium]|jgi:D-3-phosphoglycerate dehydrogenase|nr:3-phosphoglycerate dehydrogenase [Clostridiales bacterium]